VQAASPANPISLKPAGMLAFRKNQDFCIAASHAQIAGLPGLAKSAAKEPSSARSFAKGSLCRPMPPRFHARSFAPGRLEPVFGSATPHGPFSPSLKSQVLRNDVFHIYFWLLSGFGEAIGA
jgi:hypothetical protein